MSTHPRAFESLAIEQMVVVKTTSDASLVELAQVVAINLSSIRVRYFFANSASLTRARWLPVITNRKGTVLTLGSHWDTIASKAKPYYYGTIDSDAIPDLILDVDVLWKKPVSTRHTTSIIRTLRSTATSADADVTEQRYERSKQLHPETVAAISRALGTSNINIARTLRNAFLK